MQTTALVLIGLVAGTLSGMFGIGGGIIIVPALIYGLGFSQRLATGTSLVVLLPPVGAAAVIEYYRRGEVDVRAALLIAASLFAGAWLSSRAVGEVSGSLLRGAFGVFLVILGGYMVIDAFRL